MTDTAALEEILSKFSGNKIDSKEFLNLLLTSDENGIDYLQNLKKEFKENYVNPVFKKVTDHYKKLDNVVSDENKKKDILEKINDPFDVVSLNKEYRKKTKEILDKKLKDLSDNLKTNPDADVSEKIKTSPLSSILPKTTQAVNEEQKTFTPKENVVSLSENTINKLVDIFGGLNAKNLKNEETTEQATEGGGMLASLGKLLLYGGVAAGLISMFWSSHIKPWLEEKLDMKLGFLDRFEGTIEGISKFFTMGGLKLTGGWLFNIVGKAFTTFGEMLEGSLNAIFKLGFGNEVVEQGAKAAPAVWKTLLPKVAGGLFKGVGLASLKAIPIVGALISFYFAYDRFQKNDNIGGIIDVLNGIVGFIPYAGVPLSLGLSALNAFLDYKAGDIKGVEGQQSMKMDYVNKIGKFIEEIPFVGGLIKWGKGFYALAQGNWKEALDNLTATPFLGPFPAILQGLVNSNAFGTEGTEVFSWDNFMDETRKSMFRWILSFIPKIGGLRGRIAKWYGLEYDDNTGDIKIDETDFSDINNEIQNKSIQKSAKPLDSNKVKYSEDREKHLLSKYEEAKKWEKQKKQEYDDIVKQNKEGWWASAEDDQKEREARLNWETSQTSLVITGNSLDKYRKLKNDNNPETEKKSKEEFQENPQKFTPLNQKDFSFQSLMTNSSNNSILFDKNTNTANILDKEDNILAYKKDGVFDVALQELTKLVASINKGIYKIPESLENIPNQSPVVISNGGGETDNSMAYVLGGARDPIYEFRRSFRIS